MNRINKNMCELNANRQYTLLIIPLNKYCYLVLHFLFKVLLPRNFRYLFYCFIKLFKRLRVFRYIDEQYPSTRSGRIFRLKLAKTGFHVRNFSAPCFGPVTS